MKKFKVPLISMTQYSLDIPMNTERIIESILVCKQKGILFRPCNEWELSGNNCNDHFFELDFIKHCYKYLVKIIMNPLLDNIVYDIGMPFWMDLDLYNVVITVFNKKIINIRPKIFLANSTNYRETRYFKNWEETEEYINLPNIISKEINQDKAWVSNKNLNINGFCISKMICQEVWDDKLEVFYKLNKNKYHLLLISNASEFSNEKEKLRLDLFSKINKINSKVYIVYNNLNGYDGDRLVFDGNSILFYNDKVVKSLEIWGLWDFSVDFYEIEYEEIYGNNSINIKIDDIKNKVNINYFGYNSIENIDNNYEITKIVFAMTSFLYFYLKYSKAKYFVVALSGGSDSSAVAGSIKYLCKRLYNLYQNKFLNDNPVYYFKTKTSMIIEEMFNFKPISIDSLVKEILVTLYLGTNNSTSNSHDLSLNLSKELNSLHYSLSIGNIYNEFIKFVKDNFNHDLKFKTEGGSFNDDLILQNLQARIRLISTYLASQTLASTIKKNKFGLVLSTSNLDEIATGYYTKFDNSCGDLGIIGSLSKSDVKNLLNFYYSELGLESLKTILNQKPTAELRPVTTDYIQTDEDDLGMSYKKIEELTENFIHKKLGYHHYIVNNKVDTTINKYFNLNFKNRHKVTVIPPNIHIKSSNLDDNRYNFRPILYPDIKNL